MNDPRGQRPRSREPRDIAEELSERRSRALEEPLDLRLRQREPFPVVEVRNPLHKTAYLVMRPAFPDRSPGLCTCTDFARRGLGTCKHIEATGRWLARHLSDPIPGALRPEIRVASVWQQIDQRIENPLPPTRSAALRFRYAGGALFGSPG